MVRLDYFSRKSRKKRKAKKKLQETLIEKVNTFINNYDAIDQNQEGKRRVPHIEQESEESILGPYGRLQAIAYGRELERNFSAAKGHIKQLKLSIVGASGGKIHFNSDDEALNKKVADYFNKRWAKNCDYRDDTHFNEMLKLCVSSIIREGSCLLYFDGVNGLFGGTGKLIWFEADQLTNVNQMEWEQQKMWLNDDGSVMDQVDGVIHDKWGKIHAYIVTAKRGMSIVSMKDVTILPKSDAKLCKRIWRFNQLSGIPELITTANDYEDLYEMLGSEKMSGKLNASIAGKVKKTNGPQELLSMNGDEPESILDATTGSENATPIAPNYDNFEALTGGFMEYLQENEDFEILDMKRPSVNFEKFYDFLIADSGRGLGMAKAYSRLSADSSYTSFRGDMALTWMMFYDWQKWLERHVADWIAKKVLNWAQKKKIIPKLPADWDLMLGWSWPKMPAIDTLKENNGIRIALKNGQMTFRELLGPDWKAHLQQLSDEMKFIDDENLPLSIRETVAGAVFEEPEQKTGENNE